MLVFDLWDLLYVQSKMEPVPSEQGQNLDVTNVMGEVRNGEFLIPVDQLEDEVQSYFVPPEKFGDAISAVIAIPDEKKILKYNRYVMKSSLYV